MYAVRITYRDGSVAYWSAGGGWVNDIAHARIFYDRAWALRKARYERGAAREGFVRELKRKSRYDRKQAWSPRTYAKPQLPEDAQVDVVEIE